MTIEEALERLRKAEARARQRSQESKEHDDLS